MKNLTENEISNLVIGVAIELHKAVGPGLLEAAYEAALESELKKLGLNVKRQYKVPFIYKDVRVHDGYRADLIIEDKVIIELKATEGTSELHFAQLLTYLRLTGYKLGLLINFNTLLLKDGIHRVVNNL